MSGRWVRDEPSLRDFISLVLFHAPDQFPVEDYLPPEEQLNLDRAFDELRGGLPYVRALKDDPARTSRVGSLLERAYDAYAKKELPTATVLIYELERELGFKPRPSHGKS